MAHALVKIFGDDLLTVGDLVPWGNAPGAAGAV